MQEHEGREAEHFGFTGKQRGKQPPEADRFLAQVGPHDGIARAGRVALVEQEVDNRQHGRQAFGERFPRRDLVGNARQRDLLLGAHDALRGGCFGLQECARDLACRQPAKRAQRERSLRGNGKGRVAAGEQQAQPVVGKAVVMGLCIRCRHLLEERVVAHVVPRAPQEIDQAMPRDRREPCGRAFRNPFGLPVGEGFLERILQGFFGEVEVSARAPDQARQYARAFPAGDLVDDTAEHRVRATSP